MNTIGLTVESRPIKCLWNAEYAVGGGRRVGGGVKSIFSFRAWNCELPSKCHHRVVFLALDGQEAGGLRWALWRHQSRAPCGWLVLVLLVDGSLGLRSSVSIHRVQMHRRKVERWVNGFVIGWWWLQGKQVLNCFRASSRHMTASSQWKLIFPNYNDCLIFSPLTIHRQTTL